MDFYEPDRSWRGKLRRRVVRLQHRRPLARPLAAPLLSFAFDDVPASAAETGRQVLESRGVRGTFYIASGLLEDDSPTGRVATPGHVKALAEAGHEIGCHTYSHLDCGPASGAAVAQDMERNVQALAALGVARPETFAYPYGEVTLPAKREAAERFSLSRALHPGLIGAGADLNQAPAVSIEGEGGEAKGLYWLDRAAARSGWIILFAHAVEGQASRFGVSADTLGRLIDAARARGIEVVTVAEGARRAGAHH